jgi:hypothetical protein
MTKIALVTSSIAIGGVSTFILDIGQQFREASHDITVLCFQQELWWLRLAECGLTGVCLPVGQWDTAASHTRRVVNYLIKREFDVVFVNITGWIKPAQLGIPFLPDRTNIVPILHSDSHGSYAYACMGAEAWYVAIGVSPKVQQTLAARLPGKVIRYIPHGISLPKDEAVAHRQEWAPHLRILYVGRWKTGRRTSCYCLPSWRHVWRSV